MVAYTKSAGVLFDKIIDTGRLAPQNGTRRGDVPAAVEKTGAWLHCFAMTSKVRSFDIAVKTSYRDQLPDSQIMPQEPVEWQSTFLYSMHQKAFAAWVAFLRSVSNSTIKHTNSERVARHSVNHLSCHAFAPQELQYRSFHHTTASPTPT